MSETTKNPARLLVIDDDLRIRTMLVDFLGSRFDHVRAAKDEAELLEALGEGKPDLAIVDVMLQEHSGLDLMEKHLKPAGIPTVILSARGESEDRVQGLERGALDYIAKPFEPKELVLRIENLLKLVASPA